MAMIGRGCGDRGDGPEAPGGARPARLRRLAGRARDADDRHPHPHAGASSTGRGAYLSRTRGPQVLDRADAAADRLERRTAPSPRASIDRRDRPGTTVPAGLVSFAAGRGARRRRGRQMAFTLGFHIILASLGVAFPAMMLIANYRGLRKNDPDALLLARALVEGRGGDVRGRRGHRHGAVVRVRPAVAGVHGPLRRGVRRPVRGRGHLLLPRGDLHRDLHLRLEAAVPAGRTSGRACRS